MHCIKLTNHVPPPDVPGYTAKTRSQGQKNLHAAKPSGIIAQQMLVASLSGGFPLEQLFQLLSTYAFFGVCGSAFILLPTPLHDEYSNACKLAFLLGLPKQADKEWGHSFIRLMVNAHFVMDERLKNNDIRGLKVWYHKDLNESFMPSPGQGTMRKKRTSGKGPWI